MSGSVYKLTSPDGYFYFGSTILPLGIRLSLHKRKAVNNPNIKVYKKLNAVGWGNVDITTVTEGDKSQIKNIEDRYINNNLSDNKCLNSRRSYLSREDRLRSLTRYNHEMVTCPHCGNQMKRYVFYNHIKRCHQRPNTAK